MSPLLFILDSSSYSLDKTPLKITLRDFLLRKNRLTGYPSFLSEELNNGLYDFVRYSHPIQITHIANSYNPLIIFN